jgi:hypothetical protein
MRRQQCLIRQRDVDAKSGAHLQVAHGAQRAHARVGQAAAALCDGVQRVVGQVRRGVPSARLRRLTMVVLEPQQRLLAGQLVPAAPQQVPSAHCFIPSQPHHIAARACMRA